MKVFITNSLEDCVYLAQLPYDKDYFGEEIHDACCACKDFELSPSEMMDWMVDELQAHSVRPKALHEDFGLHMEIPISSELLTPENFLPEENEADAYHWFTLVCE